MDIPLAKARLVTEIHNGKKYFYAAWSHREKVEENKTGKKKGSGKSKVITHKKYLGTEKAVLEKLASPKDSPQKVYSKEYGLPVSVYTLAKETGLMQIMDEVLPYKVNGVKASEFIIISAISKLNGSISKAGTGEYFNTTVLPEVMGIKANKLNSKSYWSIFEKIISEKELKEKKNKKDKEYNDKLTIEEIEELIDDRKLQEIEEKLWSNLLKKYKLLLDILLYDGTNYFTYYQEQTRNSLGQKGKNKKGRNNLRQIGLFVAVTGDGFPFISQLACGHSHDASLFSTVMGKLIKRYHKLMKEANKIRMSFDKGNNSKKNIKAISETEYVGSLSPSNYEELASIDLKQYDKEYKESRVYEEEREIFSGKHKIFITYNEKLKDKQERSFFKQTEKVIKELRERFSNHKQMKAGKLKKELDEILSENKVLNSKSAEYIKYKISKNEVIISQKNEESMEQQSYKKEKDRVIKLIKESIEQHKNENDRELDEDLNNILHSNKIVHSKACRYLNYEIIEGKLVLKENEAEVLKKGKVFGKNIIFTNNLDANHVETIRTYHERYKVEGAFETIKDHRIISLHPVWHWTDSKIRIDAFISVLAYLLINLLRYLAKKEGLEMSIPSLITALSNIREVVMAYSDKSVERKLEEVPLLQEKLLNTFGVIP